MSLFVKICGLTSPEAVDAAVEAGADAVGFVFHGPSPRNLAPAAAASLSARLPGHVRSVAVTLHPPQSLVDAVLTAFTPDLWQTDAEDFLQIALPGGIGRCPVYRAGAIPATGVPPRLLFEGCRSGSGATADWVEAAALARRAELILGGGLNAANVAAAVRAVRPFGVDTSSGVESVPGRKDPLRIREFVQAARAAAAGVER